MVELKSFTVIPTILDTIFGKIQMREEILANFAIFAYIFVEKSLVWQPSKNF